MILRFASASLGKTENYAVCFATRTQPPEAALLRLTTLRGHEDDDIPTTLVVLAVADRDGCSGSFCTDETVAVRLTRAAVDWKLVILRQNDRPGMQLNNFCVTAAEEYTQDDLDAKRAHLLEEAAALRAVARLRAAKRKATQPPKGAGRKRRQRTERCTTERQNAEGEQRGEEEDNSSNASEAYPRSEEEQEWSVSEEEALGTEAVCLPCEGADAAASSSPPWKAAARS